MKKKLGVNKWFFPGQFILQNNFLFSASDRDVSLQFEKKISKGSNFQMQINDFYKWGASKVTPFPKVTLKFLARPWGALSGEISILANLDAFRRVTSSIPEEKL